MSSSRSRRTRGEASFSHVRGHGGMKGALRQIQRRMPKKTRCTKSPGLSVDNPVLGGCAPLAGAFVMHVTGQHTLVAFAADSEMPVIFED
jgi:hypothetical protein